MIPDPDLLERSRQVTVDFDQGPNDESAATARSTWAPVDLAAARHIDSEPETPQHLTRGDGVSLAYPGRIHWLAGESESCKTWFALHGAAQVLDNGGRVLFVDFEDDDRSFRERLDALSVPRDVVDNLDRVRFIQPAEPLDASDSSAAPLDWLDALAWRPDYAVIDGVNAGMELEGLDPNSNTDVARWIRQIIKPLVRTGATVAVIDHVTKSREERGRYAIGGVHKLNAVDGAAYTFEPVQGIGRAFGTEPVEGLVKVRLTKDRRGWIRGRIGQGPAADMHLTAYPDGGLTITLGAPGRGHLGEHERTIADHLHRYDGATKTALRDLGNSDAIDAAVASMIDRGEIDVRKEGTAHRHYLTPTGHNAWPPPGDNTP